MLVFFHGCMYEYQSAFLLKSLALLVSPLRLNASGMYPVSYDIISYHTKHHIRTYTYKVLGIQ